MLNFDSQLGLAAMILIQMLLLFLFLYPLKIHPSGPKDHSQKAVLLRLLRRCFLLAAMCTFTDLSCVLWYIAFQDRQPIVFVNNGYIIKPRSTNFRLSDVIVTF